MMKIGTHNSATSVPGYGWLSKLVTPFARTQTKSLTEQWKAGCRYFDFRVRKTDRGWVFAHGLWESKHIVCKYLYRLNMLAKTDTTYISITYEGQATPGFVECVERWARIYPGLRIVYAAEKKPEWNTLWANEFVLMRQGFKVLDGTTWHTLLPIPWLWHKIYGHTQPFDEEAYTLVDFL